MKANPAPPSPLFLAGPTAAGKSEVALLLAEQLGGEIISVDSMQVYRGMDIGTAKPTPDERAHIPHHLLDVAEPGEPFDAARFCVLARAAVADIQSRRRLPVFCGGTGLYFKAYLEGLGEAPPSNPGLREQLEAAPMESLLRELAERDPVTFDRIDRRNPRRVIRAVEVIRLTGKPFSAQRAGWNDVGGMKRAEGFFVITRPKAVLDSRINSRVDAMFARGLVTETRRLLDLGLGLNPTALQAIGYRQVAEYLRGERSLDQTIELVKIKTRQFAKRQLTWFRRQATAAWIDIAADEDPGYAANRILAGFSPGMDMLLSGDGIDI